MKRAAILWLLLALFVLRVVGQLLVALGMAPFLPPMEAWYSGLLPYEPLLVSQLVIIGLFAKICVDVTRGEGYFARPHRWLDRPLRIFGWLYVSAMVLRYALTMRGIIPVSFHLVLAAFLLVLAGGQRRARSTHGIHH
jgi:hypothetical protein